MYVNYDIDYMKWLKDKNIIVFGAGKQGKKIAGILNKLNFHVAAYADNDRDKQGQTIEGVKVIAPQEAEELLLDHKVYIVPDTKYSAEMKKQISEMSNTHFIGAEQIDFCFGGEAYYDEDYFAYQKAIGEAACKIDVLNFKYDICENDVVVEFGAGGGYLLDIINAKEKIGIEINDAAIENAKSIGIKEVKFVDDVPDDFADVIISTHALEHVDNPLEILQKLKSKLKDNGKMIFVVPYQSDKYEYHKNNIDNEFWNWNCLTLGNLFKRAGYFVTQVEVVYNQYPPNFIPMLKETGLETLLCIDKLYSKFSESESIRIVARK